MKTIIIFVVGIFVGSYYPDIFTNVKGYFLESGARDKVIETLQHLK